MNFTEHTMEAEEIGEKFFRRETVVIEASSAGKKALEDACGEVEASGRIPLLKAADASDIAKVRFMRPNTLLLSDEGAAKGEADKIIPVILREFVDWKCSFVYQASSPCPFTDNLVRDEGFGGVLRGNASSPAASGAAGESRRGFWTKLFRRRRYTRPLVKIGGIKRSQDANLASGLGADIIGFELSSGAENIIGLINSLPETESAMVVSVPEGREDLYKIAAELLEQGKIDAVEFDGKCPEDHCSALAGSAFYRKRTASSYDDVKAMGYYGEARAMLDPFTASAEEASSGLIYGYVDDVSRNLWLSGGIGCHNVKNMVKKFRPELVEASECLNGADGGKDPQLMRAFFKEVLYAK